MPASPPPPLCLALAMLRLTNRPARTPPMVTPRAARTVVPADRPSARNRDMHTILNHRCDKMWARPVQAANPHAG